mgnify:CR=1 FL=1
MSVNVYLAGKFKGVTEFDYTSTHNWRDDILACHSIKDTTDTENDLDHSSNQKEWKVRKNGIADGINCTGPFFVGDHRVPVINNHGWDEFSNNLHKANNNVFNLCKHAIDKSDVLFAWINSSDCHGTLVEIGYAYQRVKHLVVVYSTKQLSKDVWFPSQFAGITFICDNPRMAFWKAMRDIGVCSEYIYIAWEQGTSSYKIGRSCDPIKRIDQLNSGTKRPNEVELLRVISVYDSYKEEAYLHQKFSEYRIRGEWFNLHPLCLDYLMNSYYKEE